MFSKIVPSHLQTTELSNVEMLTSTFFSETDAVMMSCYASLIDYCNTDLAIMPAEMLNDKFKSNMEDIFLDAGLQVTALGTK